MARKSKMQLMEEEQDRKLSIDKLPAAEQAKFHQALAKMGFASRDELVRSVAVANHSRKWLAIARPNQLPPADDDWLVWLIMSGRGFGKSRLGGEWLDSQARRKKRGEQVLLAGRTPADVRDYCLYGAGGILTHHPDVEYQPANRRLIWPNGVEGLIRSGANPEEFRGFSGEIAWLDEFAAWDYPAEAWMNMAFGMREGNPRICVTTTPRPIEMLKEILKWGEPMVRVVKASSYENKDNLSPKYIQMVLDPLKGTRTGRQEIEAEMLEDVEGALWNLKLIEDTRIKFGQRLPRIIRIAIGVDPQGVKKEGSMTGIVVAGLGEDGHVYVLADASINGSPFEWGEEVVKTYQHWKADIIAAEKNYGGEMVEANIRAHMANANVELIVATRAKIPRAEPISSLYERHMVHHVHAFPEMETEMCSYSPTNVGDTGIKSPNRMDALVWAITVLTNPGEAAPTRATWGKRRTHGYTAKKPRRTKTAV